MGSLGTWIVLAVQSSSPVLNQDLLILLLIVNRTDFRRLELTVVLLECPVTGRTLTLEDTEPASRGMDTNTCCTILPQVVTYHTPP